jgi:hypothetical protein
VRTHMKLGSCSINLDHEALCPALLTIGVRLLDAELTFSNDHLVRVLSLSPTKFEQLLPMFIRQYGEPN